MILDTHILLVSLQKSLSCRISVRHDKKPLGQFFQFEFQCHAYDRSGRHFEKRYCRWVNVSRVEEKFNAWKQLVDHWDLKEFHFGILLSTRS